MITQDPDTNSELSESPKSAPVSPQNKELDDTNMQSDELNKHGVAKWFIELMKGYDGLMSSPKGLDKNYRIKAKQELYTKIEAWNKATVIEEHQKIKWQPDESKFIEAQADRIQALQNEQDRNKEK